MQDQEQEGKKRRLPEDMRGVVEKRERAAQKMAAWQGSRAGAWPSWSLLHPSRLRLPTLCWLATWMRTPPVNKTPTPRWVVGKNETEGEKNAGSCLWPRCSGQSRPWHRIEGLEGPRRVARSGYRPAVAPRRHGVGQHGSNPTTPSRPWPGEPMCPSRQDQAGRQQRRAWVCGKLCEWRPNGQLATRQFHSCRGRWSPSLSTAAQIGGRCGGGRRVC